MAVNVQTVVHVARVGSRVVRYLIRPARRSGASNASVGRAVNEFGRDPWLDARLGPPRWQRGASLTRRALGLGVLALLSVLGAGVVGLALLLLGLALASGSDLAGWLLGLTLLLAVLGAAWTVRRAGQLIRAQDAHEERAQAAQRAPGAPGAGALPSPQEEEALLFTWRTHERALPSSARPALRATVIATRDALRASASETTLSREVYDARQAAREDLPELLGTYRALPRTPHNDAELRRQLALIEQRMQAVVRGQAEQQSRRLKAHGHYLEDKYQPQEPDPES